MKYWLDLDNYDKDVFYLNTVATEDDGPETIFTGRFSEIGIEEEDDQWTNKLDDFFEKELGISPDEWEVG